MQCALCHKERILKEGHIIPRFTSEWLKRTSVTGKMRSPVRPNVRIQDGLKARFLCEECEQRFSASEKLFAENIFEPYAARVEDPIPGQTLSFKYDEWLLRFAVSLQWRQIIQRYNNPSTLSTKQQAILESAESNWRRYLLGEAGTTGGEEHHLIFLRSLEGAKFGSKVMLAERVNFYLLRSIDGTIAYNGKGLWVYTKPGPMVFLTALAPEKLKGCNDSIIHKKGLIGTPQHIENGQVGTFLMRTRPIEVFKDYEPSEKQKKIMEDGHLKHPEKYKASSTFKAQAIDRALRHAGLTKIK